MSSLYNIKGRVPKPCILTPKGAFEIFPWYRNKQTWNQPWWFQIFNTLQQHHKLVPPSSLYIEPPRGSIWWRYLPVGMIKCLCVRLAFVGFVLVQSDDVHDYINKYFEWKYEIMGEDSRLGLERLYIWVSNPFQSISNQLLMESTTFPTFHKKVLNISYFIHSNISELM